MSIHANSLADRCHQLQAEPVKRLYTTELDVGASFRMRGFCDRQDSCSDLQVILATQHSSL